MNRDEKKALKTETKRFDSSIRLSLHFYGRQIEEHIDREHDKLDKLPEQIRDSSTGEQIEESSRMLEELSDKLEEIESTLDEILSLAETSSIFKTPDLKANISNGRNGIAFHAIFPSSLTAQLKEESIQSGLSMNEIVCRALTETLDKEKTGKNNQKFSKT